MVGDSATIAARWRTPLDFCFIDGGHGEEPAWADFRGWAPHVAVGGWLAIHDVFPDPADGGRPPYELFRAALDSKEFVEDGECGSLRDPQTRGAVRRGSVRSRLSGSDSPRNRPAAGVAPDNASAASTMAAAV